MDGNSSAGHAGRPIKRGRGGGSGDVSGASSRGRGGAARGGNNSFVKRKLAGTPLFRPDDSDTAAGTSEDSGDELPSLQDVIAKKAANAGSKANKMAKVDALFDAGAEKARKTRFETVATENRYLQLKPLRERERKEAIASGLIPDPLKPRKLDEAIAFEATCTEMCPEFEREEREFQKNVDRWEMTPGTNRIDRRRAVKAFHRPAAGNEQPLPSDVRPPEVLKETLDYLFHDIIAQDPDLADSHPFLRDRTRAIRQDFTLQNDRGSLAIECHERIARYHILCLHVLRENENFSESQELEQLRKVLQSLNEFYEDARHEGRECPHEAEFRAYYLITHLRDSDTIRQMELLPQDIFNSEHLQAAIRLHALAQRNNESRGERGRRPANSEASLNAFSRFFKAIASDQTSYLLACLAETHFADIRRGALVCLRKAYMAQHPECPLPKLTRMLGCDDAIQCADITQNFGFAVVYDDQQVVPYPIAVILHRGATMTEYPPTVIKRTSHRIVGAKLGEASFQAVIDGQFYSSHVIIPKARRHIVKKPSISRRSEKSTSPRTSLKAPPQTSAFTGISTTIPTPPISLPASPSLGNKKAPLVPISKALNAQAPSFTPSYPKPSSSLAMPMQPAPVASTSALPTIQRPPATVVQQAAKRKASAETRQLEPGAIRQQDLPPARTLPPAAQVKSSTTSTNQAGGQSSTINELAESLLEHLLRECLSMPIRNIAADTLGQVHAEQQAMLESERNRVVDVCAGGLLENVVALYSREAARGAALACSCDRRILRNSMNRWQKSLYKVRAAKTAREKRKRQFESLSGRLGLSPRQATFDQRSQATLSPEIPFAEPLPDPFVELEDASMQMDNRPGGLASRYGRGADTHNPFWTRDTLGILICDLANKTFSTFRATKPPDWRVLVLVSSLTGSLASWYRCKLGMSSEEDQRTDRMPYVHVEFVLITEDDLHDEDLQNVGLVILNIDEKGYSREAISDLDKRLSKASRYQCQLLQVDWQGTAEKLLPSAIACKADTNDPNAGMLPVLSRSLQQVHLNNSVGNRLSAAQVASSFLDIWRSCSQTMLASVTDGDNSTLLSRVLVTLVKVLRTLPDYVGEILVLHDDVEEALPPSLEMHPERSIGEQMQQFVSSLPANSSLSLGFLRLRFKHDSDSTSILANELCEGLATIVHDALSSASVHKEATLTELQDALVWWKDTVIDQTADLLQEIVKNNASSGQKRRRTSGIAASPDSDEDAVAAKRPREVEELQASAWLPERLSSLNALLAQTRELLSAQR